MVGCPAGEAARRSGFSIDTLRYYEKAGLVPPVARDGAGRRCYSDTDLGWLGLVRCLRDTGMALSEVKALVDLTQDGPTTTAQRITVLESHDRRIAQQIADLRRNQAYLRDKLSLYQRRDISDLPQ